MAVPAVTIQLDELNRRNNRTLRWLYAALALMATLTIAAVHGASNAAGLNVSSEKLTGYVVGNPP